MAWVFRRRALADRSRAVAGSGRIALGEAADAL